MSGVLNALATAGVIGNPQLTNRSLSHGVTFPGTARVALLFGTDGILTTYINAAGTAREPEWGGFALGLSSIGGHYQIRLTVSSGSAPSSGPAVDTWHDLSTQCLWELARSSLGASIGSWLIEIRDKASQTVRTSATYSVNASVSSP